MAESSIFWENNNTGDGVTGGYIQAKWVAWLRALFTKSANRGGVSPDYLNKLVVAGTSSPVTVATGAAICYGFYYENDASMNVNVPTPAVSTRIDRIVLRVDWTAQTVRVTRVAGSEGGSAPSLTQVAGTTWDVPLAQVSITTGGVITVTDQREWLDVTGDGAVTAAKLATDAVTTAKLATDAVETAKIKDLNVTTAKLANDSVDDAKVGDRVPQFYRRQGGHASNWDAWGTTTYTPGAVRMQGGTVEWTGSSSNSGSVSVTFPTAFSGNPIVFACSKDASLSTCGVSGISANGFNIYWTSVSRTTNYFTWIAIGPE